MNSLDYYGWCLVENTVSDRLKDGSLVHTFSSKKQVRRSTKLINQRLKKLVGIKTYSQYVKCKKQILAKIKENRDVTDDSDFSDNDYKEFYNSFNISSKNDSKADTTEECFLWLYIEKKGRKNIESTFCNYQHDDPKIWEPNIDISVIENDNDPHKNIQSNKINGLINKQFKAKSCSPHKDLIKMNFKNVSSVSTSKLEQKSPAKYIKESQCSETKRNMHTKSPKSVKRNLTSVINSVGRKAMEPSEGEDWNDEFASSDFQAHSTQIFSDTLSEANRGRRSVSRPSVSQNEMTNQPKDSGIEEDSREDNSKHENVPKENKLQKNHSQYQSNEKLLISANNAKNNNVNKAKHKLPLKIIGEEKLTTKYKIINNVNNKPKLITEEEPILKSTFIDKNKDIIKKKSECSSDSEYLDPQNLESIYDVNSKIDECPAEYYDSETEIDKIYSNTNSKNKLDILKKVVNNSKENIDDGKFNKLPTDHDQLFTDESTDESDLTDHNNTKNIENSKVQNEIDSVVKKMPIKCINQNTHKQIKKIFNHLSIKSDGNTDNESMVLDKVSLQSSTNNKHNLSKKKTELLKQSSDQEQSIEIPLQTDLSAVIQKYKKSCFIDKDTKNNSKLTKSIDIEDNKCENLEMNEKMHNSTDTKLREYTDKKNETKQTQKHVLETTKLDLADSEESSESEEEEIKNNPIEYIIPDKKSDSEESEISEVEEKSIFDSSKYYGNEEEGILSVHAERRLAQMKKIDFANYTDTEESEEEKNSFKTIKNSTNSQQELDDNTRNCIKNDSIIKNKNSVNGESDSDKSEKENSKIHFKSVDHSFIKNCNNSNRDNEEATYNNKLENKDNMMSSQAKRRLQQLKHLDATNDNETNGSSGKQNNTDSDIDIEEHKITMPEDYQEPHLFKLIEESNSCSTYTEKNKSKANTKSNKNNKMSNNDLTEKLLDVNEHYNSENKSIDIKNIAKHKFESSERSPDVDVYNLSPKVLTQLNKLKRINFNNNSDEESDEEEPKNVLIQDNKINIKFSDDEDDSDRSMSPSVTYRLSQFKKMNLLEEDNSSSSSECEEIKKNYVSPKKAKLNNSLSDDSDAGESEKLNILTEKNVSRSNASTIFTLDCSKEPTNTSIGNDTIEKIKIAGEKEYKNNRNIISETQESADIEEDYVESQEMFSSLEDLTKGLTKDSLLKINDKKIADKIAAAPELSKIIEEKITNISQLVEKENLLPISYKSTISSAAMSPEDEIFLLEVPKNVFNNNLIGEKMSFFKTTLSIGNNSYEAFKKKTPTYSCVLQSEEASFETINIRPVVSIITRRKKLVDEHDDFKNQEEKKEFNNNFKSVEKVHSKDDKFDEFPTKSKKKKAKIKDVNEEKSVKVKTLKKGDTSTAKNHIDSSKKNTVGKKIHKKENILNPLTKSVKMKKSSKKESTVFVSSDIKEEVKPFKKENVVRNKFSIKRFIISPKKEDPDKKKKTDTRVEEWGKNRSLKRNLSALCDDDDSSDDKNNVTLSPFLKKQKITIENVVKNDSININETKAEIKKIKEKIKTKTKAESTKSKVAAESLAHSSKTKSKQTENLLESKESGKKRKMDIQPNKDLKKVKKVTLKTKAKDSVKSTSSKSTMKKAKLKMENESAEVKNMLFDLFQKSMKCDQEKLPNKRDISLNISKYSPLEILQSSGKKNRLDLLSSSSDDENTNNPNKSFKMREKPKLELYDESSSSSSNLIHSSQSISALKYEVAEKPKKIFFNE